jgi:methanogenic corrinoid protein MtbC1
MSRRTSTSKAAVPSDPGLLSIGALATATRIPVQTLRTWERRYGSPQPMRKPSGHRLYPVSLVGRLRKVAQLLERGHRPREILTLTSAELDSLVSLAGVETNRIESPQGIAIATPAQDSSGMSEMLLAVKRLDRDVLLGMFKENWIRLGPLHFLQQCAGSLMEEVGVAWHDGKLEIRHEHFATACLASFLREVREPFDRQARGPRVIAAMLPGDVHEGGLLMASVILAIRGCRLVYLGSDIPLEQITAAAREREAQAVALSVSAAVPLRQASAAIAALRRALPRHTALWVGGAGAPKPPKGVERFKTLVALDEQLAARA